MKVWNPYPGVKAETTMEQSGSDCDSSSLWMNLGG